MGGGDDWSGPINAYYKALYTRFGQDVRSLGWSEQGQRVRFEFIRGLIPDAARSILDIGCGFGDFAACVAAKRPDIAYTGWDINPDFIEICQRRKQGTFALRDILKEPPPPAAYDVCVLIGALNTGAGNNDELARTMIGRMYEASRIGCLFSATSMYVDDKYRDSSGAMYYYDPGAMFGFAKRLARRVDLFHSYLPHDFCLAIWKDC